MKTAGIIIILISPLIAGLILAKRPGRALGEAEGFLSMLAFIRYRISAFLSIQADIFADFENDALESCGFLPELRSIVDPLGRTLLEAALEDYGNLLSVDKDISRLMRDFAGTLGRLPLPEQLERCGFYSRELDKKCADIRSETAKRARLCRLLGAAAGLFFAILLI